MGFNIGGLRVDKNKQKGIWVDYATNRVVDSVFMDQNPNKFFVCVAKMGNPEYTKLVSTLTAPHIDAIRRKQGDMELLTEISKKAAAQALVVDWCNLVGEDGTTPIPYSRAKAIDLFNDNPDFYSDILDIANTRSFYSALILDESKGNSLSA